MASPDSTSTPSSTDLRRVGSWLYLSAAITIVIGIACGFIISPIFFALIAVGLIDGLIAYLFSTGRLGGAATAAAPDVTAQVEADPSYNPYARED